MNYLFVQQWDSTNGNHAGMVHMCNLLYRNYPDDYQIIICPQVRYKTFKNRYLNYLGLVINKIIKQVILPVQYRKLFNSVIKKTTLEDRVFLLEYLHPNLPQYTLAKYIRKTHPEIQIYGLAHLTPSLLRKQKNYKEFVNSQVSHVDKVLTLGSSLSLFLQDCGINANKISTGFHYVDNTYYSSKVDNVNTPPKIIVQGGIQRNYDMLQEIVSKCPNVQWCICYGKQLKVAKLFEDLKDIELYGYLEESELKFQMGRADISLNLLDDTVGSNVITTSMAMGLAIITSDVGSIRDYCSNDNAIFCENKVDSFVKAINYLAENPNQVLHMKKASLRQSDKFSIVNINKWLKKI